MNQDKRKKLPPPTHFEPEYLHEKYELLRKSVFKQHKDKMKNNADQDDLFSAISAMFLDLVNEFNPNRGVDFPYYIKKMLGLRTNHYVTKYLKNANRESFAEEEFIIEDVSYRDILQRVVDLNSLDPDLVLGEKHRQLMEGLLIHNKTLKQMAEEEGVPVDRYHARLYFLLKKLRKAHKEHTDRYGEDLY